MSTGTTTLNETFTLTHARRLSSKVAADMLRCQQNYGLPGNQWIETYATELALLLNAKALGSYEFGFKKGENRVVSWFYKVDSSGNLNADDSPGRVSSAASIEGAEFFNFVTYSLDYVRMEDNDKNALHASLPFRRNSGSPPKDGLGRWVSDKTYSAAGTALVRSQFIPF